MTVLIFMAKSILNLYVTTLVQVEDIFLQQNQRKLKQTDDQNT